VGKGPAFEASCSTSSFCRSSQLRHRRAFLPIAYHATAGSIWACKSVLLKCRIICQRARRMMRAQTAIFKRSREHVATIGFNEACGLWQIVVALREEIEFFCPTSEVAFATWNDEFTRKLFPRAQRRRGCRYLNYIPMLSSTPVVCSFSMV
jgi:hypothetical protein